MKIKIDKDGYLEIERGGKIKEQYCPYDTDIKPGISQAHCGDWCPLFGEPEPFSFDPITGEPFDEKIELDLCRTTLSIDVRDFEDER